MRSLFKRFWAAVNRIEIHFRSVSDMSRSTKAPKGIQVPGSNSFKNTLKRAWRTAWGIFKMVAKFCYEKYSCGVENSSRSLCVSYERLSKACCQRWTIIGKFKHLQKQKTQDIQLDETQKLWILKVLHVVFKFHIRMDDSGHQREKETVRNFQWLAWN